MDEPTPHEEPGRDEEPLLPDLPESLDLYTPAPFDPFDEDSGDHAREPQTGSYSALSPDTDSFFTFPAPSPTTTFEPPEFDSPEDREGSEDQSEPEDAEQDRGEEGEEQPQRSGRLARSTAFFSLATAASRVAGLVREIVAARYFGVTAPMSAFTIAFQVPNLVRSLFADAAIQAAFVPVYSEKLERHQEIEAFRLASTLILLVTTALGAITALFVLLAPIITPLFAPGFQGHVLELTVSLSRLLFPILIMLGLSGMVVGVLNSYNRFAAFAVAPFFWNVVIVVVLVLLAPKFAPEDRIYAYAIGIVIGTAVQLAIPCWDLRNTPYRFKLQFKWSADVRKVLLLMLPVTISLGLINFNLLINSLFATLVSDEGPAAIDKAFRIYMLPQGIFSVAVATVVFPTLSRYAARGAIDDLRATAANGMRQIVVLLTPAAAAILVLADPMVRLVYQRGEFTASQTHIVSVALFWFAFSLPFNGLFLLFTRTFFSLQRPWIPSAISAGNLVITAVGAYALYHLGVGGIVAATVLATIASVCAQAVILRLELNGIELGRLLWTWARVVSASALLAGVSYGIWYELDQALGQGIGGQIISMGTALSVGAAVYFVAARLLRVAEIEQLLALARR